MYPSVGLRVYRYVAVLAEVLNFTRAAARLHVAQPSLATIWAACSEVSTIATREASSIVAVGFRPTVLPISFAVVQKVGVLAIFSH
jgi:hypothetical protein